jgi:hypothetical protein
MYIYRMCAAPWGLPPGEGCSSAPQASKQDLAERHVYVIAVAGILLVTTHSRVLLLLLVAASLLLHCC